MSVANTPVDSDKRRDARHVIGSFVAPGTAAGALEGFMVVDLSRDGMSLLRVGRSDEQPSDPRGLDHRFSWLAIPLPERGRNLCALAEVVHRKRYGPLEWIGVRFEQISERDRDDLEAYLAERDQLSFGAPKLPIWTYAAAE